MANIKICNKCGKIGLDQYDYFFGWHIKNNKYYYRTECKECENDRSRQWNEDHKEQKKENDKQWCKSNPEYCQERNKQWYENNKEYFEKYGKQWRKDNKDKCNAYTAKRRVSKLYQTPINAIMIEIRKIYSICTLMNELSTNVKWEIDHIIPLSKGGLHHQDNLQILTLEANRKKSDKTLKEKGALKECQ